MGIFDGWYASGGPTYDIQRGEVPIKMTAQDAREKALVASERFKKQRRDNLLRSIRYAADTGKFNTKFSLDDLYYPKIDNEDIIFLEKLGYVVCEKTEIVKEAVPIYTHQNTKISVPYGTQTIIPVQNYDYIDKEIKIYEVSW